MPSITQWAQADLIGLFFRSTLLIFVLAISLSVMGDSAAHPVSGSDVELFHSNKLPPSYKTAIPEDANESVINEQNSGAPYIVANGVSMHEVSHSEAGGWDVRAPGDDRYGNGELIVVSVEFSEPVHADSDMTFRIQMGSVNRGLVPVDTRGSTVLFGALIRPQDRDGNGIWIGDNTATLDHNDADSIRSRGNSPRNADWTHPSLGTQSDHKVDGSATRPRLRNVKLSSKPQHAGFYVRGETVQISARFDRAVVIKGDVSSRLNVEALQKTVSYGGPPNRATVSYSLLNGVMTNSNVRYDMDTGKIVLRAGGSTSRTTPAGEITGLATPELTATASDVPLSHDGLSAFTFELTFSEEFPLSYRTPRDDAFTASGGSIIGARRLDRSSNIRWEIKVRPSSTDDVTLVLPVPEYCGATGAICTADGRELSETLEVLVPGPCPDN